MPVSTSRPLRVLICDDCSVDTDTMLHAIEHSGVNWTTHVIHSGAECIPYIERMYCEEGAPPQLLLLDINMPGLDGMKVLKSLQEDERLRGLRVVVLSSSSYVKDVNRSYHYGASGYLIKPSSLDGLIESVSSLDNYWNHTIQLSTSGLGSGDC